MSRLIRPVTLILGLLLALSFALIPLEGELYKAMVRPPEPVIPLDEELPESTPITTLAEVVPLSSSTNLPSPTIEVLPSSTATVMPSATFTVTPVPTQTATPTTTPTLKPTATPTLSPDVWKNWPVMPSVNEDIRLLYQVSVEKGLTDPHAFSVLGDCQSEAEAFLGVFDTSPTLVKTMADDLQAIIAQYSGSFNRYNPAAKSGSSAGSLLYAPWNDNKEGKCKNGETPIDCELRVHRPSIVFVHIGTHFETPDRNLAYMKTIIKKVIAAGAVPVMVTKADNLEHNEFVNKNIARLAAEFGLPTWNFWASVQDLPSQGLKVNGMHLTDAGNVVHQMGALRALEAVWNALRQG